MQWLVREGLWSTMRRSAYSDELWDAFAWMLEAREVLRRCRPFVFRASLGTKLHAQDERDALELDQEIKDAFPHPWEIRQGGDDG